MLKKISHNEKSGFINVQAKSIQTIGYTKKSISVVRRMFCPLIVYDRNTPNESKACESFNFGQDFKWASKSQCILETLKFVSILRKIGKNGVGVEVRFIIWKIRQKIIRWYIPWEFLKIVRTFPRTARKLTFLTLPLFNTLRGWISKIAITPLEGEFLKAFT